MLKKIVNVKTRLPKDFLSKYLNQDKELEAPPMPPKKHTPYFSNILCKFFVKNCCTKGAECIFAHDLSLFPCPDSSGSKSCDRADCLYKHDHVSGFEDCSALSNDVMSGKSIFVSPFI